MSLMLYDPQDAPVMCRKRPNRLKCDILPIETHVFWSLSEAMTTRKITKAAWAAFGVTTAFYLFEFLARNAPGAAADQIQRDFAMTAAQFGIFSSLFFLDLRANAVGCGHFA